VRPSLAVVVVAGALAAGACSTPGYTGDAAVRDLERQSHLTRAQAECIVKTIRGHFETEIEAKQRANNLTALPADRLKLEVDSALAALRVPTGAEQELARTAIAACAPAALR
jgi:type IV pilus biogenesis protein CpaD/CtpE